MSQTYLTTDQLAERIHYDARTIRTRLKDVVLLEGVHYIRPFGGRKLLFIWEAIQRDIGTASADRAPLVPMANGDVAGSTRSVVVTRSRPLVRMDTPHYLPAGRGRVLVRLSTPKADTQIPGRPLDEGTFRRQLKDARDLVKVLGAFVRGAQRPAQLYRAAAGFAF